MDFFSEVHESVNLWAQAVTVKICPEGRIEYSRMKMKERKKERVLESCR